MNDTFEKITGGGLKPGELAVITASQGTGKSSIQGRPLKIAVLDEPAWEPPRMTREEYERYKRSVAEQTCPFCEAGVPHEPD